MKVLRISITTIAFLAIATLTYAQQSGAPPAASVKVGDPAPDFTLKDQTGKQVSLHDYKGRNVALAFYVFAFSPG